MKRIFFLFLLCMSLQNTLIARHHSFIKKLKKTVTSTLKEAIKQDLTLPEAFAQTQTKTIIQPEETLMEAEKLIVQCTQSQKHLQEKQEELDRCITKLTVHLLEKHDKTTKQKIKKTLTTLVELKAVLATS